MMNNLQPIPDVYLLQQQFNVYTTSDAGIFVFKSKKSHTNIESHIHRILKIEKLITSILTSNKRNIPHDYIERPGNHNWEYWSNAIKYQLLFFNDYFKS